MSGELHHTVDAELRHEGDKIKGSRFIATIAPIRSEDDVEAVLTRLRCEYPAANHHCYAYRLGPSVDRFRYSDDGEPNGTGGRPILQQLDGRRLTDTLIVITRIFGGTKLGAGGLVRAYSGAAGLALDRARIRTIRRIRRIELEFAYDLTGTVQSLLTAAALEPVDASYGESVSMTLEVAEDDADELVEELREKTAGRIALRQESTRA
jgi:uncharacterized YigZ family protein